MMQVTEFPYVPPEGGGVEALVKVCRDMPVDGETFREFRRRLKAGNLWNHERYKSTLVLLDMVDGGQVQPSALMREIAELNHRGKIRDLLAERLWTINPLMFKTVVDLLEERVYSRDEIVKHVDSFAYPGTKLRRPEVESWLALALGIELVRPVGIALTLDERGKRFSKRASDLDVEEYLEEVGDTAPSDDGGPTIAGVDPEPAAPVASAPAAAAPAGTSASVAVTKVPARASGVPDDGPSPLGRGRPVAISRFAGADVFVADVLAETVERIEGWWAERELAGASAGAADFGFDAEAWMEGAAELLYRIGVAAALVFRLGTDRSGVKAAYDALAGAGVLDDLYYGTAPDSLPANVDPQALMLASVVARRCAEAKELASELEKQKSAGDAFKVLDNAFGRGLFGVELFWIMGVLKEVGAIRHDDLADYTALPHRVVRDTLFRLGFIASPYASGADALVIAAAAARRATGNATPPDEVLAAFAASAGCAYDCPHRKRCDFPCRERAEM